MIMTNAITQMDEDFNPRAYQIGLFEQAVEHNSIIYLPTGAGKTYIAVMLIKKFAGDLTKPYQAGGKRTIFAVNTVALANQQCTYLARHTHLTCSSYTGEMGVDFWSREQWMKELENNQMLVMTSQIFLDLLNHGYMSLSRVNLMIFDECHRGVNDHPMRLIMQRFQDYPKNEQPRVLGLSATLLNGNVKITKVDEIITELETTFHAKVIAAESLIGVKGYATNPEESVVTFNPPKSSMALQKATAILLEARQILGVLKVKVGDEHINESDRVFRPKTKVSKWNNFLMDLEEHLQLMGIYGGSKAALLHTIQFECFKKSVNDQETIVVLDYLISVLTGVRKVLEDEMAGCTEYQRIMNFSTDQVRKVFDVILKFNTQKLDTQKFCALIFVKRRFTAKVLYHVLKNLHNCDKRFEFLLAEFLVGFSSNLSGNLRGCATNLRDGARETLCHRQWNKNVLHKFKNGQANCIIATDVVEEGIDIPDCTLVVRYDLPADIRSYIQSKGRARHATSKYVLLVSRGDGQFDNKYRNYKLIERMLEEFLVGKSQFRTEPSQEALERDLYSSEVEPYSVRSGDQISTVTATSAIGLVNRYCCSLGQSHYVSLIPTWKLCKKNSLLQGAEFQVSLRLPSTSPLQECIIGDVMHDIKQAKRSAAIKCCKKLHEMGELTDNLLPVSTELVLEQLDYLFPNWIDENKEETCKPGTEGRKRQHHLIYPECLYAAFPKANEDLYLHILSMKPMYSVPQDNRRRVFHTLLSNSAGFAILSSKKMPKLSSFSIFMNVGELNVDVEVNHCTLQLPAEKIEKLRLFHTMIFTEIMQLIKVFMVHDKDDLENSFLIVPVDGNWGIDWGIVMQFQKIDVIKPEKPINVRALDYELALLEPNYRAASIYVVTQICEDRCAESSFPTPAFYSYVHYFQEHYGINIDEKKQPLLEVKPISKKINCLRPRGANSGLSKRRRDDLLEDFEEHLVPELCNRYEFPSLYWLKATTLPSIIHRITQLLIAEQLRVIIHADTKLGILALPDGQKWKDLRVSADNTEIETTDKDHDLSMEECLPETVQTRPELTGPNFDVLDSESRLYPWVQDKIQEPIDIQRNIEDIQLLDIDYYERFMRGSTEKDAQMLKANGQAACFMSKPLVQVPNLKLLSQTARNGPQQLDIMTALTSKMSHDVVNLEILETLGDSFLKFYTSLFLIEKFANYSEGHLSCIKGKIIGNRNLFYAGLKKNIPGMIKVDEFAPYSNFIVPTYSVQRKLQMILLQAEVSPNILYHLKIPSDEQISGYLKDETLQMIEEKVTQWESSDAQSGLELFLGVQTVSDKTVADCIEALIGVYLETTGIEGAARILQWFQIIPVDSDTEGLLVRKPSSPIMSSENPNHHMPWADLIEKQLGYKFKNRGYLLQAFSHASYSDNTITSSYERLEFLGDAVLDFLITVYIYENCQQLTPGQITDLRSALVNNITFACLATRYGLHKYLLSYSPLLSDMIDRFASFQEQRQHVIDDELLYVLLEETNHSMAEFVSVPKILGDIFESLAGAIYLDSGKNLAKVWEIFYAFMHTEIDEFSRNVPKQPVRVLYETQGVHPKFFKPIVLENKETIMIPLEVTIRGKKKMIHGFGGNTKEAKCAAAKQALKEFRLSQ